MPAGRKGKYTHWLSEDGLIALEGWAREGLTGADIANKIGVVQSTYYAWLERFPVMAEAIRRGKAPVDFRVENQLLKSALGYTVTVKEPIKVKTKKQLIGRGTIEEEHVEYADREIYIKADVTAQIFWLKNRKAYQWRDKREVTATENGMLADLIDGLKEPLTDDLYTEAASPDGALANE